MLKIIFVVMMLSFQVLSNESSLCATTLNDVGFDKSRVESICLKNPTQEQLTCLVDIKIETKMSEVKIINSCERKSSVLYVVCVIDTVNAGAPTSKAINYCDGKY